MTIVESTGSEVSDTSGVSKECNVVKGAGHVERVARWTSSVSQVVVSTRNTIDNTSGGYSPVALNLETSYKKKS